MTEPTTPPTPDSPRTEEVHRHFLSQLTQLPHHVLVKARDKVKVVYGHLEQRYGPHYAKAIVGAGLAGLPVPVPFSTALTAAPVLAAAELHRDLSRAQILGKVAHGLHLAADEVEMLGKNFIHGLLQQEDDHPSPAAADAPPDGSNPST